MKIARKYLLTFTLYCLLTLSFITIAMLLKQSDVQYWWEQYVASYNNLAGFSQFILSAPRRVSFFILAACYCYYWAKIEGLDYSIASFWQKKWYCFKYYLAGILFAFTLYFLSEACYLFAGYAELKTVNISWLVRSGIFVIFFSSITSFTEELIFRKILLESFLKKTNSFLLANFLQAIIFAALHLLNPRKNLVVFFYSWVMSALLLGFLKKHSQSIALPMGFHTGFHANCLFFSSMDRKYLSINGSMIYHIFILVITAYAVIQSLRQDSKHTDSALRDEFSVQSYAHYNGQ